MTSWLGLELRHLSALVAVAEQQSFRGAADRLGYVQSAVSQRIAQLEQIVGVRLVERTRGHRHVELTDAGRVLLGHAERIDAQLGAARADVRAVVEDVGSPRLDIGVFEGVPTHVLARALALLAQRFAGLQVHTREALSDERLFADAQSGKLDAAFAELPLPPGRLHWRELFVDPSVLVVPVGSPLARSPSPPSLREIAAYPIVAYRCWRMFASVEARFAASGIEIDTRFAAGSRASVQALVGAGLGVAVLPRSAVDLDHPATDVVEIGGQLPARTMVCCWTRDRARRPALDAFIQAIERACAAVGEPPALATPAVRRAA